MTEREKGELMVGERVRVTLIVLVSVVWAVNYTASVINPAYKPDPAINAPFLAVIGALVAGTGKSRDKDTKDGEDT